MTDSSDPDHEVFVETAPEWQTLTCPGCGEDYPEMLQEGTCVRGSVCPECLDMIAYRFDRRTDGDEGDTEQTTLMTDGGTDNLRPRCFNVGCDETFESVNEMIAVPGHGDRGPRHFCEGCAERIRRGPPITDGGRPTGELERFAIDQALRAAWDTEWWLPFDPDYGFVEYFEAAATRNLGLLRGFEELADDVDRRGILLQSDSDQAQLVTDGGAPDPDDYRIPTIAELDAMRADANLSMRDLSACAGFKDNRFTHILNNDVNPQTRTIRAFLTALQEFDGHSDTGDQGPDPRPSDLVDDEDGPTEVDADSIAARLDRLNPDDVGEDPTPPESDETLLTDGGQHSNATNSEGGVLDAE